MQDTNILYTLIKIYFALTIMLNIVVEIHKMKEKKKNNHIKYDMIYAHIYAQ